MMLKSALDPMSDSMQGGYRLGGSHWRYPRAHFWDATGEHQAQLNDSMDHYGGHTQYIHWTVRMLGKHPAVLPLKWLDRNQPKESDDGMRKYTWSLTLSESLPAYNIPEYPPTGAERDLTIEWAPTALMHLKRYNAIPMTGAGNLAFCMYYLWGHYDKGAYDIEQYLPSSLDEYRENIIIPRRLVFIDGIPYMLGYSRKPSGSVLGNAGGS